VASTEIDRTADTPLWLQLRLIILEQLQSGEYKPFDLLPSESEFGDRYQVSRPVVRASLSSLVEDGFVYKVKGKGSFVAQRKIDEEFAGTTMGFWEEMLLKGRHVRTRVHRQELCDPPASAARALELSPKESSVYLRRLYIVDGSPTILVDTWLASRLVPNLERTTMENRSLYETLRRRYGLHPTRADRWIEASLAEGEDAVELEIEPGTPVLSIYSIAYLVSGAPVEYYEARHRTDKARLHVLAR
jgi:GntR family transcriptional regulator